MPDQTQTRATGPAPECRTEGEAATIGETPPDVGALVLDIGAGRLAEYRGPAGARWLLRSYLGSYEWEARPEGVRRTETARVPGRAVIAGPPCEECDAWWWAEQLALDEGELSEATDCRVYLRRHHGLVHGDTRRTRERPRARRAPRRWPAAA